MPINDYYRLCGGTFFTLVLQARRQRKKAREYYSGDSDGLSDPEVLVGLIKVINPDYADPGKSQLKSEVNNYKSCRVSTGTYLPFGDNQVISAFDTTVRTNYQTALNEMFCFVNKFLDLGESVHKDANLVRALVDLIQQDQTIAAGDEFYIEPNGEKKKKVALGDLKEVCLPSFLLGVWHYTVVNRTDNDIGKKTYDDWCPPANRAQRKYTANMGDGILESVTVYNLKQPLERIENALGNGKTENIVPAEYKKPSEQEGFETYIREAQKKYSRIKLPGGEERLLSEYFVCNSIGKSAAAFPYRKRIETIEEATLSKIRSSDRRGDIRYSVLVGACGYGKTLMLQHLFLEAADHFVDTGVLPLFAELRNYTELHGDLVEYITECAKEFDVGFSQEKVEELLQRGQAAILFDGLDEMDPTETKFFQKKLSELLHHYPSCQIVISSRQCSAIRGLPREFNKIFLHPLNEEQSQKLVENLLANVEDQAAKKTILSFSDADKGYIRKNGFVATNPMLLTIMVRNYEKLRDCAGDKAKFYGLMYAALIREHDEEKESFDRFFHSVSNGDEFTQAFRELCAISYVDGADQFSSRQFEKYFKKIKAKQELQNPSIFQLSKFQHDVCATACVMYEQDDDIYYIDPGLQDYFFSEYYYFEETEATRAMGHALGQRHIDSFRNLDALNMLYKIAPEKMDVCVLLPYLNAIFKAKTEDDAFLRFLSFGFGEVTYTLLDKTQIDEYMMKKPKPEKFDFAPIANSPKNILMGFLLDHLDLDNTFVIGSLDESIQKNKFTKYFVSGYYDSLIDAKNPDKRECDHIWLRGKLTDIRFIDDTEYYQNGLGPFPVIDNTGRSTCFGFVYVVDPLSLTDDPDQQKELLALCEKIPIRSVFERVKQFYMELARKQEVNRYQ